MVDAPHSKCGGRDPVPVRVRHPVPTIKLSSLKRYAIENKLDAGTADMTRYYYFMVFNHNWSSRQVELILSTVKGGETFL